MPTVTAHRISVLPDLTAIRERKGISLEQIARSTKISARYLEAIERSEFEQLPGGVFRTSYIRQYARAIDYDEWDLLAHFGTVLDAQTAEPEDANPQHKFLGVFKVPEPLVRLFGSEKRA
jgi:cytoskeletal protein RodZ